MATSSEIQYKTITQYAQLYLNYISSNVPSTLVSPLGPVLTALAYATALVAVALQRLVQIVLKAARLSTAEGTDVDSFVADFGISRLQGVKARGNVNFTKLTSAVSAILIPVGTVVQTSTSPPVQFGVVADSTQPNFNLTANGYYLNPGQTSVTTTVEAILSGTSGNVSAAAINKIISSIPGIDNVTNSVGFTTGIDPESDADLRTRFVAYIQSLGKATKAAIGSAISNVQAGLFYSISEYNGAGNQPNGIVNVYVDDGAGTVGSTLISQISGAIDSVRPAGVRVDVTAATPSYIAAVMRVVVDKDIVPSVLALQTALRSAIFAAVNGTALPGDTVHYAKFFKSIFNTISPGNVVNTRIATYPPSTASVLQLQSTEGLVVGQLIDVAGSTTYTKQLPVIQSIDGLNQIHISPPLTTNPNVAAQVQTFSVRSDQITDVHDLLVQVPSFIYNTTLSANCTLGTSITVTSATGMSIGDYVIVTDETRGQLFQANPSTGLLIKITNIAGNVLTLNTSLGILTDVSPYWVNTTLPPTGSTVVVIHPDSTFTGTIDLVPANTQTVLRMKAALNNSLLIQMEPE